MDTVVIGPDLCGHTHWIDEPGYKVEEEEDRLYFLIKNAPHGLTRAGLGQLFSQLGVLLQCKLTGDSSKVASSGVQVVTSMIQLDSIEPHLMTVHWQVEKAPLKMIDVEEIETIESDIVKGINLEEKNKLFVTAMHEECHQFGVKEGEGKDDTGDLDVNKSHESPAYHAFERHAQTDFIRPMA